MTIKVIKIRIRKTELKIINIGQLNLNGNVQPLTNEILF